MISYYNDEIEEEPLFNILPLEKSDESLIKKSPNNRSVIYRKVIF